MRNILLITSLQERLPGTYYTVAALANALEFKITLLYTTNLSRDEYCETDPDRHRGAIRHERYIRSRLSVEAAALRELIGKMIGMRRRPFVDVLYLKADAGDPHQAIIRLKPYLLLLETGEYRTLRHFLHGDRSSPITMSFPMLVIPERQKLTKVRAFNFATDLDREDISVIKQVLRLTTSLCASLSVYHVSRKVFVPDFREEENIAEFRAALHGLGPAIDLHVLIGRPVDKLLADIGTTGDRDILVLVQRLHSFTWYLFHDSITEKAVSAYCPILLLPETYCF